jgi:serine/threonine-protein kinase
MRQDALIGRKVANRFTVKRFLGEGGMASVYVAEQDDEPREVALKIMNPDLMADRAFVKRFEREAKAAARVKHANSVAILGYGVEGRISYIAMELVKGDDLYVLLERHGALGQARAARILADVCDALAVAHELGIVHRDLKPENIMVVKDPSDPNGERVKVLDFGIAKLIAADEGEQRVDPRADQVSQVTRAGTFIGTPAYMSPEQCSLLPVDTRADIYTCGVLLFQLITCRLPFEGETPLHTATLHIHNQPPRPSEYAPDINPRLEAAIMKALSKKPADRFQTARSLSAALRKLLPELSDTAIASTPMKPGRPVSVSLNGARSSRGTGETEAPIESARTVVAEGQKVPGPPPAIRVRPAAGAPPPQDDDLGEDEPTSDGGDPATLIRPPALAGREPEPAAGPARPLPAAGRTSGEWRRYGPQNTEVIDLSAADAAASTVGAPAIAATPPATAKGLGPSAPIAGGSAGVKPVARPEPRPTLKSAGEFAKRPGAKSEVDIDATTIPNGAISPDSVATPKRGTAAPDIEIGKSTLPRTLITPGSAGAAGAQPPDRPPSTASMPKATVVSAKAAPQAASNGPASNDLTRPVVAASPSAAPAKGGDARAPVATLQTATTPPAAVPAITTTPPVKPQAQAAPPPAAPPADALQTLPMGSNAVDARAISATMPMLASGEATVKTRNPLLATAPAAPSAPAGGMSGSRGMLLGFLAGLFVMAIFSIVYLFVLR